MLCKRTLAVWMILMAIAVGVVGTLAWSGVRWRTPDLGILPSGDLDYIISAQHFNAINHGMTLKEACETLDLGQRRLDPVRGTNMALAQDDRRKIGDGNLNLLEIALAGLPTQGEFWFDISGPFPPNDELAGQSIRLRIKDGKVIKKELHLGKLVKERAQARLNEPPGK